MVLLLLLLHVCDHSGSGENQQDLFQGSGGQGSAPEAHEVIYSLYLPTDISGLFEETGTSFMPEMLMPLEKIPLYEDPEQLAQMMGALGVDMSYCKLFERLPESATCYTHIELLADKLGLPDEIFDAYSRNLEDYFSDPDSLTGLIHSIYSDTDRYFRSNDQESLASLSLMGGWIEAMYIAANLYREKAIIELGNRILQQKYGLNSLVGLLGNFQESLVVRRNMHLLDELRELYDQVEILYDPQGFQMNPGEGIFQATISGIICAPGTLDSICRMVIRIREEIML